VYRPEGGKFDVETIDPFLCTHYIFGFTGLRNGEMVVLDSFNEECENWGKGNSNQMCLVIIRIELFR